MMRIREYRADIDCEAVIALSERLADFELPARVVRKELGKKQMEWMAEDLDKLNEAVSRLVVLVNTDEEISGFLELQEEVDWLTSQKQAYLSRICLARDATGKGYAKKLMLLAEEWAITQGYTGISLMVVATNEHAIDVYRSLGYEVETMKMRKELR